MVTDKLKVVRFIWYRSSIYGALGKSGWLLHTLCSQDYSFKIT